jgi:glycosyltransferase involved in cell wall biosynthesis
MVDIVVPVYNTPIEDLQRCFDSISKQTYKDYKVYIIDDGSKEEVKKFIDIYCKDKQNFKVKHIVNGGVSNARNIGINLSKDEYITFVDSDDTIERNFLKEATKILEDNDLDVIIGGYNEIKDNKITRIRKSLPGVHIYEGDKVDLFFIKLLSGKVGNLNKEIGDTPTGRIYTRIFKRKSIGSLRFDENVTVSEDTLFMIDYTMNNPKIGITDKVWYNYYKNSYSITSKSKLELKRRIQIFKKEIKIRLEKETRPIVKLAYNKRLEKINKAFEK